MKLKVKVSRRPYSDESKKFSTGSSSGCSNGGNSSCGHSGGNVVAAKK